MSAVYASYIVLDRRHSVKGTGKAGRVLGLLMETEAGREHPLGSTLDREDDDQEHTFLALWLAVASPDNGVWAAMYPSPTLTYLPGLYRSVRGYFSIR